MLFEAYIRAVFYVVQRTLAKSLVRYAIQHSSSIICFVNDCFFLYSLFQILNFFVYSATATAAACTIVECCRFKYLKRCVFFLFFVSFLEDHKLLCQRFFFCWCRKTAVCRIVDKKSNNEFDILQTTTNVIESSTYIFLFNVIFIKKTKTRDRRTKCCSIKSDKVNAPPSKLRSIDFVFFAFLNLILVVVPRLGI